MAITQTELISAKIAHDAGISDIEFLALEVTEWLISNARKEMLIGEDYYSCKHDVLSRKRQAIGADGNLISLSNLPNNRIVDNQYAKMVDQKKNYLLGKPVTFKANNKAYTDELKRVLGKRFMRTLKNAGEEALIGAIAWLYPYISDTGELVFRLFPSHEICPFWKDAAHTELDMAARVYEVEIYNGKTKETITKVDLFKTSGVTSYIREGTDLVPIGGEIPYITVQSGDNVEQKSFSWEKLPLIAIKYNAKEIPLIRRIKQLQDSINLILSDFANSTEETVHNTILVLKNYDGTDLGEFRRNLATFGAIKVRTQEGIAGDVDTLNVEVSSENYKTILTLLKKALIENARGYDAKDEKAAGSTPNQMNIQSMYSDIDLDANDTETELQAAFEDILWFVNIYLANTTKKDYRSELVEVIFNRDILINESEAIENCEKSVGIISNETIVSMHPWTNDTAQEIKQLKEEQKEQEPSDPYSDIFESNRTEMSGVEK